jgi:hypothetical protein
VVAVVVVALAQLPQGQVVLAVVALVALALALEQPQQSILGAAAVLVEAVMSQAATAVQAS